MKPAHDIFQSRRSKEKETNLGIGVYLKFAEAAEYLGKIKKIGKVDETDRVKPSRGRGNIDTGI